MKLEDIKGLGHIKVSHLNSGVVKITTEDGYWLLSGHTFSKELYARVDSTFLDYTIVTSEDKNKAENSCKYEGKTLEEAKEKLIAEITDYDTSDKVNGFMLNGLLVWLDKATRVGLMNSTTIAKAAGKQTTTLWLGGMKLVVDCDKAIQLLSALEMYALECFNVTASHKAAVGELTTIEEVEAYDYKADYPKMLEMSV